MTAIQCDSSFIVPVSFKTRERKEEGDTLCERKCWFPTPLD